MQPSASTGEHGLRTMRVSFQIATLRCCLAIHRSLPPPLFISQTAIPNRPSRFHHCPLISPSTSSLPKSSTSSFVHPMSVHLFPVMQPERGSFDSTPLGYRPGLASSQAWMSAACEGGYNALSHPSAVSASTLRRGHFCTPRQRVSQYYQDVWTVCLLIQTRI